MVKKHVSVEELKALLVAKFRYQQTAAGRLAGLLDQSLGKIPSMEIPNRSFAVEEFAEFIHETVARRLKRNRRSVVLFSTKDFDKFLPALLAGFKEACDEKLDSQEYQQVKKYARMVFEKMDLFSEIARPGTNPYEEHWRFADVAYAVAALHHIPPAELFATQETADEVTRRFLTKRQFVAFQKKALAKYADVDFLTDVFIMPMFDACGEECTSDLRQEFMKEKGTELQEFLQKMKSLAETWLDQEVVRIYGRRGSR